MEGRAVRSVAFSRMMTLAVMAVVALVGTGGWQTYKALAHDERTLHATNSSQEASAQASTPFGSVNWQAASADAFIKETGSANDPDGISNIGDNVVNALVGSYTALVDAGVYTPEEGEWVAQDIADSLRASVSYKTYTRSDIATDADTSYERMLTYRNDLRIALEPLLSNPGYELNLFANYIESKDTSYLEQLAGAVENYRAAIENAAAVVVPEDALSYHVGILNALSEFSAVLSRLPQHADDAFATAALLRTYQSSEAGLMTSFNALAEYYRNKQS